MTTVHRGAGENLGAMSMKVLVLWVKEDQHLGVAKFFWEGEVAIRLNIAMVAMARINYQASDSTFLQFSWFLRP